MEELKFLAGINHNTPFVFIHDINTMYGILIVCKELHWFWLVLVLGVVGTGVVVVGTGVSSKGRPTGCFTHGKPPFTATQSPQPSELEKMQKNKKKHRKNCEFCPRPSLFKGHNVNVSIVVLNCQKCNQCLKCQVSGHKNFQKI